ncbi:PTI1-like tyrosine-protein kinase 2 [Cryptomeria japonica]|uniref:PTI1-like tyrosine-protein kinase 2 n=1 Tax=Cryptomeria japonica TaxID=3369 RepID=UPI0027D9D65C|nr:PTI1-like tyrosine-protein kinase 2 [Cryptomeria japonica]
MLLIYALLKKILATSEQRDEVTTYSSPPSSINIVEGNTLVQEQLVNTGLSPNLQANGLLGRDVVVELNGSLRPQQEQEPIPINTNLTLEEIICMKSFCQGSYKVGEGSFAQVYRGIFQDKDLAIKKIEHRYNGIKKSVENEVELLRGIEHKNINKLYAWCIEESISYLVYMFISGCSLDDYFRGYCTVFAYSWKQCLKTIMDIAEGIEFLHKNKIIHVDIKPQNIMMDASDNEAKIVDFGFSRKADWEGTYRSTDKIIGTRGYWAPEYCLNHKLSYKHDVFSFGIVVLEMITGERHVDNARSSSQFHIPEYVSFMISNDRFEQAIDSRLKRNGWDRFTLESAFSVANIALRCARPEKAARPFMDIVLKNSLRLQRAAVITSILLGREKKKLQSQSMYNEMKLQHIISQ